MKMRTSQRSPWTLTQENRWDKWCDRECFNRSWKICHLNLVRVSPRTWSVCSTDFNTPGRRGRPTWEPWVKPSATHQHSSPSSSMVVTYIEFKLHYYHLYLCFSCVMSVYKSVFPLGRRIVYIFWLVSSLALTLRVVCRLFGVFMSCLTLPTPTWHQPVCLPPPTCSPTCLARAPSSLWVPTHSTQVLCNSSA